MAVLVTGGAGFIGSNLVQRLIIEKEEVVVIDNYNDYYDPELKKVNRDFWIESPLTKEYIGDILDEALIEKIFKDNQIHAVIHLAARAGVRPSIQEPRLYEKVNVLGTINLLEACKDFGIKKFVFGSSSSVYGSSSQVPFKEDDPLRNPISPYAATKISGEKMCHTYHSLYGLECVSLRFFTVYGPRQRPEMAIHQFARKILSGEEIFLFGDGSSSRDYTYIDDIVDGIMLSYRGNYQDEIFNLGNSKTTELLKLVELLEENLGRKAKKVFKENQPGDVSITYADLSKSNQILGYNPQIPIEKGIYLFCDWLKAKID